MFFKFIRNTTKFTFRVSVAYVAYNYLELFHKKAEVLEEQPKSVKPEDLILKLLTQIRPRIS